MRQTPSATAEVARDNPGLASGVRRVGRTMGIVLVVEDDLELRQMMQLLLEGAGYAALGAANGLEALTSIRECRPDLILLDIHMPVMDGREFRRHQTADERLSDIPVICVSAGTDPLHLATELHLQCLAKPLCFDELLGAVAASCRGASCTDEEALGWQVGPSWQKP